MSGRRFPDLIVTRTTGIDDWAGMIPFGSLDLVAVCDDDLMPGTKASVLLREAAIEFQREATDVARAALNYDGVVRNGPFLSSLPRLNGAKHELVMAWQGTGGACFIASTTPLPHLHQNDSEYAGYDRTGRIVYFGGQLDQVARPPRGTHGQH